MGVGAFSLVLAGAGGAGGPLGAPPMVPGVALMYILFGATLLLHWDRTEIPRLAPALRARLGVAVPAAAGVLSLATYVLGLAGIGSPSWMASGNGFTYALFAGAFLVHRKRPWLAFAFFLIWAALLYVILLWLLYQVALFIPVPNLTAAGSLTLVVLLGLVVAMAVLDIKRGPLHVLLEETPAGAASRRMLPIAFVVPPFIGYIRLQGELSGLYGPPVGVALFASALVGVFAVMIAATARSLAKLERRRLEAEGERRVSEQRFSKAFHASPVAMTLTQASTGAFIDLNEAAERLFGYSRAELLGKAPADLHIMGPDTRRKLIEHYGRPGRASSQEVALSARGGAKRSALLSGEFVEFQGGRALLEIMTDVTDAKAAQEQVARSREILSQAQRIGHVGSWEWDIQSDQATWSDEMFRIFGLPVGPSGGDLAKALTLMHPEDRDKVAGAVQAALEGTQPYEVDYRIVRPTGEVRHLSARGEVYRDEQSRPVRMIGAVHDLTERKLAEDQVLRSREELAAKAEELSRSNAELEQFAYVASHDLQEPLRMVASYVQLLDRRYKSKLDADADEFINFAVEGANRMQALIQDLLIYSRVGSRGKALVEVDCEQALEQAKENLTMAIEESRAAITSSALPKARADPGQVTQLLQNLLSNALKFHGPEPPRVHVSGHVKSAWCQIDVADNGIGIDPKHFDRIFVIFQRLHKRDEYPGTGIGLAVCRRIVERHGGRIWVDSSPGKGSTFHITLPAWNPRRGG